MKTTTVWAFSLLVGLAACSEERREEMREDTGEAGERIERGVEDTGEEGEGTLDQDIQEEEYQE